jgi:hypothetical protein
MKPNSSICFTLSLIVGLLSIPELSLCQSDNSIKKKVHVTYKPESYRINKIDTILSNSTKLKISHYTLMDTYAKDYGDVTPDSIECRYRDYAIDIMLSNNGKIILNKSLLKSDFVSDERYWKNLTLFKVWLDSYNNQLGQIIIKVGLGLPELYKPVIATLTLYNDGKYEIKLK